ncbi:SAM-dependent methyltransferase [Frischella sp. Ac48]|uniref:class I SAM-dependent methyltransferase n=1 Tax=Frischella sp. Ac48 TaxID=2804531 RepID=UPI001C7CA80A|nr:SAM-dependent methyltransferase [Frischella sp. Ac48]
MDTKQPKKYRYDKEIYTALDAITEAQKIAFSPILFQAVLCLRNKGILAYLDQFHQQGVKIEQICENIALSPYAIQLLLDVALSMHIVYLHNDHYILAKIGHYLLHDKMTNVNIDFTQDVCYEGMQYLEQALVEGKPSGLQVFGDWQSIYPYLSQLPTKAKKSWFEFDHFYSDSSFPDAFKQIKSLNPQHIYDVGGNTGKWALFCANQDPNIQITLLDLPQQIKLAQENIQAAGFASRITGYPVNLLSAESLPNQADLWWMSQFLDCFSEAQIIAILSLIHASMKNDAVVCIMEMFWDRQPFEAGALSLNASSLYFTCFANGNSRFYHSKTFYQCLNKAGFHVEQDIDGLGLGHTLLICKKR